LKPFKLEKLFSRKIHWKFVSRLSLVLKVTGGHCLPVPGKQTEDILFDKKKPRS
jgi:hypothetical protein